MRLTELDGEQVIFVRWQTRKPKIGDHMTLYRGEDGASGRQAERRLILKECVQSKPLAEDENMTEEWWRFIELSESEFQKIRKAAIRSESIEKTHDRLF